MRILRIVNRGSYELYAIIDGEVYRIPRGDPIEILEKHLEGELGRVGERVELDLDRVLRSRDPGYKVSKPIGSPEVWELGSHTTQLGPDILRRMWR